MTNPFKILILGGNRYFGKRLLLQLAEAGHNVFVVNRSGQTSGRLSQNVCFQLLDRSYLGTAKDLWKDLEFDVVFDQCCYDSLEAAKAVQAFRDRVGHFVFTSSQRDWLPKLCEEVKVTFSK